MGAQKPSVIASGLTQHSTEGAKNGSRCSFQETSLTSIPDPPVDEFQVAERFHSTGQNESGKNSGPEVRGASDPAGLMTSGQASPISSSKYQSNSL